jgi:hypothetical protein
MQSRPIADHSPGPLEPDLTGCNVDLMRQHLPRMVTLDLKPTAPAPREHARASRFAAVLAKHADFLADRTGTVEPPERWELIQACRFAAEQLRDGATSPA